MPGYSKELMEQYMREEQEQQAKKNREQDAAKMKKLSVAADKAASNAKLAFEQTQQNRFEIDRLRRELQKTRIIAIIAIVLAVICMAMVMGEGVSSMVSAMP